MYLVTNYDGEWQCTKQSICFDIPASACQQRVPRSSECCKIRGRCTRDKSACTLRRQMQDILRPAQRDLLECSIGGRRYHKTGVLIPRCGEPICGHCHWKRPANHETKESSAGRCHRGR